MPRRKRKVSGNRLRPLHFTESPVNIVHKIPSPVFASDHPATADVVSLNEVSNAWVSPQFVREHASLGTTRRTRQSRSSVGGLPRTRSRSKQSHTSMSTSSRGHRHVTDKFPALRFIGKETTEEENLEHSSCEEFTIEMDDEEEPVQTRCQVAEIAETNDSRIVEPDCRNGDPIRQKLFKASNSDGATNVTTSNHFSPHLPDIGECNTPVNNNPSDNQNIVYASKPVSKDSPGMTQQRSIKDIGKIKPQRRLFKTTSGINPHDILASRNSPFKINTHDHMDEFDSIPERKSKRLQRSRENFFPNSQDVCRTPKDCFKVPVLVYDTPEEEYGWSVRQRRLRRYKKGKQIK